MGDLDDAPKRRRHRDTAAHTSADDAPGAGMGEIQGKPTLAELIARLRGLAPYEGPSAASVIREERDRRLPGA
jgi:hypothetical protein